VLLLAAAALAPTDASANLRPQLESADTGASAAPRTTIVTGATGHTGSLVYLALKKQGKTVRGLVQNITKARERLGCDKCDASEGIYLGDITQPATLGPALTGADTLVITTGPGYHCLVTTPLPIDCHYYPGADPETIAWHGVKNQVAAFANSTGPQMSERHVILISNDLTTVPNNFLDKVGGGQGCFYALQGEMFTVASGLPYTIIKPNGLNEAGGGVQELVAAHDDAGWKPSDTNYEYIGRADLARLLVYAALNPSKTTGVRFDVTARKDGTTPTTDVAVVFDTAMYPWDPRKSASSREL
jgi:hypothetical protein